MKLRVLVYHGVDLGNYVFRENKEDYLMFLGRVDPSKGTHIAVKIANMLNERLVIVGPVFDREYFMRYVAPYIDNRRITYLGEVDFKTKIDYLSRAKALLYPVQYDEYFGVAMVEALACGTPVVGFARGSVMEIVRHGVNGYLVSNIDEAVNAVKRLDAISPYTVRRDAEERFSAEVFARKYLNAYMRMLNK